MKAKNKITTNVEDLDDIYPPEELDDYEDELEELNGSFGEQDIGNWEDGLLDNAFDDEY